MTAPRLLVISHTYSAAINHAKLRALAQHSRLTVIAPRRWPDSLFSVEGPAAPREYAFHPLRAWFAGRILRHFYNPRTLRRIVAEARPDLVYVEEEPASLVLAQCAALKRWGHYRLVGFTWENINRRNGVPGVERYNLARCDGLIAGNNAAAQVVTAKGFRKALMVTPQLGVDPEHFYPADATAAPGRFVVGYVGRFVEDKGLETLWRAARELPDVQMLWLGGGPLKSQVDQWREDLHPRLQVVGAVPHEQIAGYLRTLDALVLPSYTTANWKEQFGHVLIEAMACGVPVIGSDSGAIPEVIGEAGLVVPERDAGALREALARLRADAGLRARLGQAGRDRVLAHYTHAQIAAANAAFFQQVLTA